MRHRVSDTDLVLGNEKDLILGDETDLVLSGEGDWRLDRTSGAGRTPDGTGPSKQLD